LNPTVPVPENKSINVLFFISGTLSLHIDNNVLNNVCFDPM
jgi:hypothetical protein